MSYTAFITQFYICPLTWNPDVKHWGTFALVGFSFVVTQRQIMFCWQVCFDSPVCEMGFSILKSYIKAFFSNTNQWYDKPFIYDDLVWLTESELWVLHTQACAFWWTCVHFADFASAHFHSNIASASNSSLHSFMFGRQSQTLFISFLKLCWETNVSEFCFVL